MEKLFSNYKTLFNKLNNLDYSAAGLASLQEYIESKHTTFPEQVNTLPKRRRYANLYKSFVITHNLIVYKPLNFIVVPADEKKNVLDDFYKNYANIGMGVTNLYKKIIEKYLNIKRSDVNDFLEANAYYQMTRPLNHHVNKVIIAKEKGERFAIDLIDMSRYSGYNRRRRYILTCIDYYTRYSFTRPLLHKTAVDVREQLRSIFQEARLYPKILQKDNGGEFQGEVDEFLTERNIKYINTKSYSPQSNGLV